MSAVADMIEAGHYDGDMLVVLDGLKRNPQSGMRCVVWFDGSVFKSYSHDGGGRGYFASALQRVEAVQRSLDGYLDIVNNGI